MPAIIGFCLSIEKAFRIHYLHLWNRWGWFCCEINPLYMSYIFVLRMFSDKIMPHLLLWVLIEFTRKSFNRECFVSCNFFCATLDKQKPLWFQGNNNWGSSGCWDHRNQRNQDKGSQRSRKNGRERGGGNILVIKKF